MLSIVGGEGRPIAPGRCIVHIERGHETLHSVSGGSAREPALHVNGTVLVQIFPSQFASFLNLGRSNSSPPFSSAARNEKELNQQSGFFLAVLRTMGGRLRV